VQIAVHLVSAVRSPSACCRVKV